MVTDYLKEMDGSLNLQEMIDYKNVHIALLEMHKSLTGALIAIKSNTVSYNSEVVDEATGKKDIKRVTAIRIDAAPQALNKLDAALKVLNDTKIRSSITGAEYKAINYIERVALGNIQASTAYKDLCLGIELAMSVTRMHLDIIYRKSERDTKENNILLTTENLFDAEDRIKRCLNPLRDAILESWDILLTDFTSSIQYIKGSNLAASLTQREKDFFNSTNTWIQDIMESTELVSKQPIYTTNMKDEELV